MVPKADNEGAMTIENKSAHVHVCFFLLYFVCISAFAHVYFKTTIIKQNIKIILIAGLPSSQALPGFLITAPPSVVVPAVLGTQAVWIPNQKKKCCVCVALFC